MTATAKEVKDTKDQLRELATKIYVNLVDHAVTVKEGSAQITTNPENLAKISFKLADAFHHADLEHDSANKPKGPAFDMLSADISGWTK